MTQLVKQKLREIIAAQAMVDVADICDATTPQQLGLDSIGLVEAVFAIEEHFDIQVTFNANEPDDPRFDISTVGAMTRAVEALISQNSA